MSSQQIRVYADTSVFGRVYDEEFMKPNRAFFDQVKSGRFKLVTSVVVWKEIKMAPLKVRSLFHGLAGFAEVVEVTEEAMAFQREFIQAGIVPEIYHDDALHVALATVCACGLIVSWNFKHIVNFRKIPLYNGISQKNGYPAVSIHSPLEVIENEVGEDL